MDHQPWRKKAKCAPLSIEATDKLFYVGRGQDTTAALIFCNTCPVRAECLNYAIVNKERGGVFGGLNEQQRDSVSVLVLETLDDLELVEGYKEARPRDWPTALKRDGRSPTLFRMFLRSEISDTVQNSSPQIAC